MHKLQIVRNQLVRRFSQSAPINALKPFLLADIGEGIKECEVIQWYIQPNARVDEFDPICEVQSDKATVEITSRYSGVVKTLHYKVGQMAQVGSPLLDIDADDLPGSKSLEQPVQVKSNELAHSEATPSIPEPHSSHKSPTQSTEPAPAPNHSKRAIATPAVRRICKENDVDILKVSGSGKDDRVLKEDVLKYLATATATTTNGGGYEQPNSTPSNANKIIPLQGVAKQMFRSMSKASSTPHFLYTEEIEMDNLQALRARANKIQDTKLSYMPFMIKALSIALTKYPIANSKVLADEMAIEYVGPHNIAIAMDTPNGLVVPSIKNCKDLSILEIGKELIRLQSLGVAGKLTAQDLQGGSITLSNIGSTGGMYVAPVIVESQVCIGGIGRIRKLPRFDDNDNVVARNVMCCSWAGDHRVLDGMAMALLVSRWKQLLENPDEMLLELS